MLLFRNYFYLNELFDKKYSVKLNFMLNLA
jgi:hypothetical protein